MLGLDQDIARAVQDKTFGNSNWRRARIMILDQFDVRGEQINDDETEQIIRKGDPHRSLVRYRLDRSEFFCLD